MRVSAVKVSYDGAGDVGVCVQFGDILARLGVEAKAHDHGQVRGVLRRYLNDDTQVKKRTKKDPAQADSRTRAP